MLNKKSWILDLGGYLLSLRGWGLSIRGRMLSNYIKKVLNLHGVQMIEIVINS